MKHSISKKGILFMFALLVTLCLSGCGAGKQTVDMTDYVGINYSGFDGNAKATAYIDYDSLYFDTIANDSDSILTYSMKYDQLAEIVSLETSVVGENVSNGDIISVNLIVDEDEASEAGIKIRSTTLTYQVMDLEPIQYLDPFAYLEVTYSGYAPYGTASCKINPPDDLSSEYSYISYEISPSTNLSNGDVITVTASVSDTYKNLYGIDVSTSTQEYIVEGLDSYVTEISQVDEETLQTLVSEARDQLDAKLADYGSVSFAVSLDYYKGYGVSFSYDEPQIYCAYFVNSKNMESDYYYDAHGHAVFRIVYETSYHITDKYGLDETGTFYSTVCYVDLIKEADGDIINTSNVSVGKNICYTSFDSLYMNYITSFKDAYVITELDAEFNQK